MRTATPHTNDKYCKNDSASSCPHDTEGAGLTELSVIVHLVEIGHSQLLYL